jgi:CRP-like cAMP-binding protein
LLRTVQPYLFQKGYILSNLPLTDLHVLKESGSIETGKRGEVIFRQGGFPKGVIWLLTGKLKIYQEGGNGQRQTLYIYSDGDLIGYRQLIAEVPHPVTAMLLEESNYIIIPAYAFRGLLQESLFFTRSVLTALAREFTVWMNRMTVFMQFPVRKRLILALLILHEQYSLENSNTHAITITRTELAEYVGASLETVVRALNKLKEQGMLKIQGRKIWLLDVEGLVDIVEKNSSK